MHSRLKICRKLKFEEKSWISPYSKSCILWSLIQTNLLKCGAYAGICNQFSNVAYFPLLSMHIFQVHGYSIMNTGACMSPDSNKQSSALLMCKCAQANAASIWTDITQSWTEKYKGRLSSFSRIFYAWYYRTYFNLYDDEHILKRLISSHSEMYQCFILGEKDAAKMSGSLGNICSITSRPRKRKLHPHFICILLLVSLFLNPLHKC